MTPARTLEKMKYQAGENRTRDPSFLQWSYTVVASHCPLAYKVTFARARGEPLRFKAPATDNLGGLTVPGTGTGTAWMRSVGSLSGMHIRVRRM